MPTLHWDIATAYDLFVSLFVLTHPDQFGVRPSWAAGVRSRLPGPQREFIEHDCTFLPVPLRWIYLLPAGPRDAAAALIALAQTPTDERLYSLLPASDTASELIEVFKGITLRQSWSPAELEVIRTLLQRKGKFLFKPHELPNLCNALAHAAEFGEAFCDALKTYHEVFFAEEEQRLGAALAAGLAEAQQLSGGLDLDDLLTTLSRGVHFSDLNHMERVIVAPSYWANPLVFYRHIQPDQALLLFGSRPEGLGVSAGESAPSHLVFVLKAVADSSRLVILRALTEGPQTPGQLARRLRLRPPTVIHHLNTLRLAGLVEITLQSETERAYTLHRAALAKTMDILSDYLGESKNTL